MRIVIRCIHARPGEELREFDWSGVLKADEAAALAALAFGGSGWNPLLVRLCGTALVRDRTLDGNGITDGDVLELLDVGGAV